MVPKKPTRTKNKRNSALTRKTLRRTSFTKPRSLKLKPNAWTQRLIKLLLKKSAVKLLHANYKLLNLVPASLKVDNAKMERVLHILQMELLALLIAKIRLVRPLLHAHGLRPSLPKLRLKRTGNAHASLVPKDSPPELLSSPPLTSWPETSLESHHFFDDAYLAIVYNLNLTNLRKYK